MPIQRRPKSRANTGPKKSVLLSEPVGCQSWLLFIGLLIASLSVLYYAKQIQHTDVQTERIPMNDEGRAMFFVADLPGKGKGVIAARDIKQGELVIRERPLFVVPLQINSSPTALISGLLAKTNSADQAAFMNLSCVNFPKHLEPEKSPEEVALAIFQTNAVAAGNGVGIFPRMARLNHGCSSAFNVVYSWREKEGVLVVYALKSIRKGEELLTTYTELRRPREQRRAYLTEHYGFYCTCSACSIPEEQSRASDIRLATISEEYGRFATWGNHEISGKEAIDHIRKIWALEDEEGYWSERGRLAADAAWIAAAHSDKTATEEWARKAIEWYSYEVGGDSEQVLELHKTLAQAWGTREKMEVGGPRSL